MQLFPGQARRPAPTMHCRGDPLWSPLHEICKPLYDQYIFTVDLGVLCPLIDHGTLWYKVSL